MTMNLGNILWEILYVYAQTIGVKTITDTIRSMNAKRVVSSTSTLDSSANYY